MSHFVHHGGLISSGEEGYKILTVEVEGCCALHLLVKCDRFVDERIFLCYSICN